MALDFDPRELRTVLGSGAIPALPEAVHGLRPPPRPRALVVGLESKGEARAYPLNILAFHQAVNDSFGGLPVTITFCPLCRSPAAFHRSVGGRRLILRASGSLLRNNLVLQDMETGSLWSQLWGRAIRGPLKGEALEPLPLDVMPSEEWKGEHPGTLFLRPPNPNIDYGADDDPLYARAETVFFPRRRRDDRLHAKEVVAGLALGGEARAYPLRLLVGKPAIHDTLGGRRLRLKLVGGSPQAFLEGPGVERGEGEGGSIGPAGDSTSLAGRYTRRTPLNIAYWFCWSDFYPATSLWGTGGQGEAPGSPL